MVEITLTPALSRSTGRGSTLFAQQRSRRNLESVTLLSDTPMNRTPLLIVATVFLTCLLFGCGGPPPPKARTVKATSRPADVTAILRPGPHAPVVHLDVYQMFVPRGAVSRSDEFWKRVDEQQIDPATYDLLLKNGVRVGMARTSEWADYFRDIFDRNNAKSIPGSILANGAGTLELPMKRNVRSQDIFYLNDQNELYGRTYEKCENLLGVSFWPERRQIGALHLTLAPVVRATRSHPEFTVRNEERVLVEVRPEYLYDLNLTTTIPPDSFLVLAPSPEGRWPTSLGSTFLTTEDETEQKEQVLVFVPRTVRGPMPASPPSAAPNASAAEGANPR